MHYLHKILVHISDVEVHEKNELIDAVRRYAENETEDAYGQAYDWRETDCAGRWSSEYPINVLFASDDVKRFVKELKDTMEVQKSEIQSCLAQL